MTVAIIIPTGPHTFDSLPDCVKAHVAAGLKVILALNGCSSAAFGVFVEERAADLGHPDVHMIYAGANANPYAARNAALKHAFEVMDVDAAALTDSDCLPEGTYHPTLIALAGRDALLAGRVKTAIPEGGAFNTQHFNWLRTKNFECYDGFTPGDFTVGANMVIGAEVYKKVGPMRETSVSGGDGDYGDRYRALGGKVTPVADLIVRKTIYGMTYQGIVYKQIRRALTCTELQQATDAEIFAGLKAAMLEHSALLTTATTIGELQGSYDKYVDALFRIAWFHGQIASKLDKASE